MGVAWRLACIAAVTLMGCGQVPDHAAGQALGGQSCFDCHGDLYLATTSPDHAALGYPMACEGCHATSAWVPASSNHDFWPLTGAHVTATCESCHANGFEATPTQCSGCHLTDFQSTTDPDHELTGLPTACEACHSTTAWRPASLDHDQFWPLRGKHTAASCESCHVGGVYAGTARACVGCHQANYNGTTDPNHIAEQFPTTCEACHSESGWKPAVYDHDQYWPLQGKHATATCASCHVGGVYAGTPKQCVACHQTEYDGTTDPNHATSGFGTSCETCHDTVDWNNANFDHNQVWPLVGAHTVPPRTCESCHANGYANTPTQCVGCHQSDYNATSDPKHSTSGFGTSCETCHDTVRWENGNFNHESKFPIASGKHRNFACGDCHKNQNNYSDFTCTGCHTGEHNLQEMNQEHQGEVANYQSTLNQYGVDRGCLHCHPDGREPGD